MLTPCLIRPRRNAAVAHPTGQQIARKGTEWASITRAFDRFQHEGYCGRAHTRLDVLQGCGRQESSPQGQAVHAERQGRDPRIDRNRAIGRKFAMISSKTVYGPSGADRAGWMMILAAQCA